MFKEEGYLLMGAAFEVYNELGYGLAEEIYQQSLEIELGLRRSRLRRNGNWPSTTRAACWKRVMFPTCLS